MCGREVIVLVLEEEIDCRAFFLKDFLSPP